MSRWGIGPKIAVAGARANRLFQPHSLVMLMLFPTT
jgi:ATP-dependent protease ClpP protease subunit